MSDDTEKRGSTKADTLGPKVIAMLVTGCTVAEAAKSVEVAPSTVHRWLKLPEFACLLEEAKRDIFEAVSNKVASTSSAMVEVLAEIAKDSEQDGRARVQAARTFLEFAIKFRLTDLEAKLDEQIAALEQRLAERERLDAEAEAERKRHGAG